MNTTHPTRTAGGRTRAALVLAGLLALAGCGTGAASETGTDVPNDVLKAYNKCMTAAGYPQVEKGTVGAPDKDPLWQDKKFVAAHERCQESSGLTSYAPEEPSDADREKENKRVLATVECLRDEGWEVEEPKRMDGGALVPELPRFSDEERQKAFNKDFQKCAEKAGVTLDGGPGDKSGPGDGDDHGEGGN